MALKKSSDEWLIKNNYCVSDRTISVKIESTLLIQVCEVHFFNEYASRITIDN